jgi:mRNA interferase RelE/StbE
VSSESSRLRIRWERRALKEAGGLPAEDRRRVVEAVESLLEEPLRGSPLHADWKGFRRLRVGDHRVIYAFDGVELLVSVVRVAHRREASRSRSPAS